MFEFQEKIITDAFHQRFDNRIVNLAAAGSIVNGRANQSSDLDLLLVLDSRGTDDIDKCRAAVRELSIYKVDLSLKYLDELPTNPALFQDGPRTALSLAYICSAHFMIGTNAIFRDMLRALSPYEFRRSVLHAIGEYVMRMESAFYDASDDEFITLQKQCFKYLTRIIIDVQLFFKPSDMSAYKQLTRPMMLEMGKNDKRIKHYLIDIDENSSPQVLINAMNQLYLYLKTSLAPGDDHETEISSGA